MMAQMLPPSSRLIDRLPPVRGRYTEDAPLARITWFRVGGPAEVMYRPADLADLQAFIKALPAGLPVTVLGVGSNTLVRDGGVPGVVLRLGRAFVGIRAEDGDLICGAGALDFNVATAAGLSFVSSCSVAITVSNSTLPLLYGSKYPVCPVTI